MKILMLTPYVPYPPSSGGQIRTYNLLKYLSKNNQITLLCLYKNPQEKKYLNQLKPYCQKIYFCQRSPHPWTPKNIFKAVFSLQPFLTVRNFSSEAKKILSSLLKKEKFDIIHAETFYIMPHLPKTNTPIFLLEQTIEYQVYQHFVSSLPFFLKPFFYFDILKLRFWEKYYWKKAYLVGTVSQEDKKIIQKISPYINPVIVPNGAGDEMIVKKLTEKKGKKIIGLFVGNFFWLQNIEAANFLIKKIVPLAKDKFPNLQFIIAGQNASQKIKKSSQKNLLIIDIKDNHQLIKKLYQQAYFFIAPIFGPGGTRLKILAAMASGLPIISSEIGVAGLDLENNKNVLIANDENQFIQAIEKIINDKNLYQLLRKNNYNLIKKKYNWQSIAKRLESIYKKVAKQNNKIC